MSDRKTLSVADLAKLNVAINVEKAVESQERVLQPRTSMYVALTGLSFSDVDENSGSQHLIVHVTPLDYAASLSKGAIVPLSKGEFTMGQFRVVMTPAAKTKDKKSGEWRALTEAEQAEAKKKNADAVGGFFGAALRAAGVKDTPTTPNEVLTLVGKAIEERNFPVGLFNASTNGPDLQDSYTKDNQIKKFDVKDYAEVSFGTTTPETVLKDLRTTSTALESAGKAHDHDAIAAALRLPDVRQYAKVAAKSTRGGRGGNGGGGGAGGGNEGGGFSGFGGAPSED